MTRLPIKRLARRSLPVDTIALARYLIGKILVRDERNGRMSGRIVETEAYPVGDSTGYAFAGLTAKNAPLFRERGCAYVRLVYGAAYTLNLAAEVSGVGAAVLIRAIEPLEGIEQMQRRRHGASPLDIARGPGRLCEALAIGPQLDGTDLCSSKTLWLGTLPGKARTVGVTTRIGLSREQHHPRRFFEVGSRFVSGPRSALTPPARDDAGRERGAGRARGLYNRQNE